MSDGPPQCLDRSEFFPGVMGGAHRYAEVEGRDNSHRRGSGILTPRGSTHMVQSPVNVTRATIRPIMIDSLSCALRPLALAAS